MLVGKMKHKTWALSACALAVALASGVSFAKPVVPCLIQEKIQHEIDQAVGPKGPLQGITVSVAGALSTDVESFYAGTIRHDSLRRVGPETIIFGAELSIPVKVAAFLQCDKL